MVEATFSNFTEGFNLHWFLLNYTEFVHETSHIKPYDSSYAYGGSNYVWKNGGGWGCGSEQAPLFYNLGLYHICKFEMISVWQKKQTM